MYVDWKCLRVVRMKFERKVKKILEGRLGRKRKKEDPGEVEWISRIGREECVCQEVKKKKSCGQNRMDIGLCREEIQGQTSRVVVLKKKTKTLLHDVLS